MSAFPKAAVQSVRLGSDLDVRSWPKADIRTESRSLILNGRFGEKSGRSAPEPSGVVNIIGVGSNYTDKAKPA